MCTKSIIFISLVLFVFLFCVTEATSLWDKRNNTKTDTSSVVLYNDYEKKNTSNNRDGKGFFPAGGLLSIGKVFNFLPVGGERECRPNTGIVARGGICLNPYDCRQREGRAAGDCAHGLGVCCVFEVTCGGVVQHNLTYFMSPDFPDFWDGSKNCDIRIEKAHAGITQMRLDFVHFNIGQPNRTTGECDEDVMVLGSDGEKFNLCGQNHGQHIYHTMSTKSEAKEMADDIAGSLPTLISIRPRGPPTPRLWLIRLVQLPLAYSAPHNCLQYFTENNGTISTFNYGLNGRHLSQQNYRACIRRNTGFCGMRYSPCNMRSFRIGQGSATPESTDPVMEEEFMPANDAQTQQDELEGSGEGMEPAAATSLNQRRPRQSIFSWIWSFIWPSWLWGSQNREARAWKRWSPYYQHYEKKEEPENFRYYGYGNFGLNLRGYGRQRCTDRITIPCDNEYFISSLAYGPGVCDPHHCGNTFCPGLRFEDCHVETSVSPFAMTVNFGPPVRKSTAEDNIGACIKYTQIACD